MMDTSTLMESLSPTPEEQWRQDRCGMVTASRVADIMRAGRGGKPSMSRARYLGEKVAERLTGVPQDGGFTSRDMEHGIDTEAEARAAYAFERNVEVTGDGHRFVKHPDIEWAGCSPDGEWASEADGTVCLVQFKCPATHTHIETLLTGKIQPDYVTQMMWEMACHPTAHACDYVSYDPRLPENMRLFIKRIPRDEKRTRELETEVKKFLGEVDTTIKQLEKIA